MGNPDSMMGSVSFPYARGAPKGSTVRIDFNYEVVDTYSSSG